MPAAVPRQAENERPYMVKVTTAVVSSHWGKQVLVATLAAMVAGCAVTTPRLGQEEREKLAEESRRQLFEGQDPIDGPVTLAQATARALKYQAENRQRQMEEAVAAAQLDV